MSLESEQAVIGCALFDPEASAEAFERLRPDHFAEPMHRVMWEAMAAARSAGAMCDTALLSVKLAGQPAFTQLGGAAYLADMAEKAMLWSLPGHVEAVADAAMRRAIASLSEQAVAMTDQPAAEVLAFIERGAAEIARKAGSGASGRPVGLTALENLEAAWEGRFRGLSTGLECMDRITGGIQPDHVWIVAGRASMGKSIVATCLARGIAQGGRGVLFFSLEMPEREVQARMIADMAYDRELTPYAGDGGNVEFADLLRGRGTQKQKDRARGAARSLAGLPVVVDDSGGLTLDDIIGRARRQVRAWERAGIHPGAILIDHLGLVSPSTRRDSKPAEAADTVDRLKGVAKQIGAPIIAAAQVNRGPENRNDHRPTMGDLNWSGSIEQIADLVCLLYRDAYYLARRPGAEAEAEAVAKQNDIELIVTKNRSGPTCTLHGHIDIACNALRDAEERYPASYRGRA